MKKTEKTETKPKAETGTVTETAKKNTTESRNVSKTQAKTPAQTASEDDTGPLSSAVKESATKTVKGAENVAKETDKTAVPRTADEHGQDNVAVEEPAPLSVIKNTDAEVIESPLKQMKAEFHQRAQVIKEQMRNIQNSFITIGFQLHWIRENKMYRVLDYRNVYEYAEKEYGIKKTTCSNIISIIENYAERDAAGNVVESIADCYRNYSASQLVAMLGMDDKTKQQVTPDMSVRAINRMRKDGDKTEPDTASVADAENLQKTDTAAERTTAVAAAKGTAEAAERKADDKQDVENKDPVHDEKAKTTDVNQSAAAETATSGDNTPKADAQDEVPTEEKNDRTLAEIDSYLDYRSMLDELDLMIKHAFTASASARVRIICVQG
ncbi:MAG: hypothetical protein HDR03_00145 [Lachnospiraceae bacterium]|nr:hypothetical protein [Lachnospiraceae bacterium]